ncbi:unnamed protein product [Hymenolepis diminuta]|uniref:LisH domain-containing protein n=1 Tax=Hymenolepis diminuta TaxID=6216 RepID=A0A564YPV9_HYMDI|nr:unnamed protein product [Hymenolepis diminuta]
MSENSPEVDGEDSDLKECLLEALRADGTLKQIQDQLSAAVYAAFYRKTAQTPVQAPSKLSSLTSEQTGLDALSLLVDFLQTLELKKTLNVLMHEIGLDGLKIERRENLIRHYNVQSISENSPILPALLDSVTNQSIDPSKLHKAVVLDQESDNENYNPINENVFENHDSNFSHFPNNLSNNLHNQNQSSPQNSINSPTRSGTYESGRSLNDKDSYSENRKSQFQSQTSSGPIPSSDENVPSTNDPSLPVATSDAPTRNIVNRSTDFDQFIQPQMRQRDNEAYSNSHLSETDTNLHTAGPVFSTTYHRYTGSNDSPISPLHNHRFNDEIMYKPTSQIQQYDNGDESDGSDIDSEATARRFRR